MKKLVLILVCFLFFACDNGTSNNNENNSIVGIWECNTGEVTYIFIFNADNTGERYFFVGDDFVSSYDIFWEIDNDVLCYDDNSDTIDEQDNLTNCDFFRITENNLYYNSGNYKRIDKLPNID